ncbi:MAG: extracellular solute-binding protein [Rhodoferax sp.]|nr:extracellular solute-binding protein [Rhodoferax sp.]
MKIRHLLAAGLIALTQMAHAQQKLTILWAQWDPANYLQQLVKDYEKETGVKVAVETTPWPDFQNKAFKEFTAKGSAYDMVIGDSQWLGAGSTSGHYVELTDFFKKHNIAASMAPATVAGYAEYPGKSGKYWGIPLQGDAFGFAYRKDWFEDPKEMAAFKARYKYDLAVPKTWKELTDIAEFFHRPTDKRYGVTVFTDNSYDALVMGMLNAVFSYGGELGDPTTYKVDGFVNSPETIESLNAYKKLYSYTPPDWGKTFFQEANQAMTEGLVAMSLNNYAFFPALANPATNKFSKVTGYFPIPKGPSGKQFSALGGQGISVISYSKQKEESMKFLTWFIREDVQKKWAALGGFTCNAAILKSADFRKATPYNEAFYQSMFMVKDFWSVPEYAELLTSANRRWHSFIVGGKGTAKEASDGLAKDWAATFKKYGRTN